MIPPVVPPYAPMLGYVVGVAGKGKLGESTMDGFLRLGALCVRPLQSICEIHTDLSLGSRCRTVFFAPNGPGCQP